MAHLKTIMIFLLLATGCAADADSDVTKRANPDGDSGADATTQNEAGSQDADMRDAVVNDTGAENDASATPDASDACTPLESCTTSDSTMLCLDERGTVSCRKSGIDGLKTCTCSDSGWTGCGACFTP